MNMSFNVGANSCEACFVYAFCGLLFGVLHNQIEGTQLIQTQRQMPCSYIWLGS
jgi:hypothetical protein